MNRTVGPSFCAGLLVMALTAAWLHGPFKAARAQSAATLPLRSQRGSESKLGAREPSKEPPGSPQAGAGESARQATTEKPEVQTITQFAAWSAAYVSAGPQAKAADELLAEGERTALARRGAMKELIRTDPRQALALAVPEQTRRQLPDSIRRNLEERVDGRGFLKVLIAEDFAAGTCEVRREAGIGGKTYQTFVHGARLRDKSRSDVPLRGIAIDEVLALEDGTAGGPDVPQPPVYGDAGGGTGTSGLDQAAGWAQGAKRVLLMRVAFPDEPTEPITEDGAYAMMDQVNQFYLEGSYGTTAMIPAVTPLLILPQAKDAYGYLGRDALQTDAREAARVAGLDTNDYDLDIVLFRPLPGSIFAGWNGQAYIGAKGLWLQGTTSAGVAAHELGHNLGLWHAGFWSATGDSIIGPGRHVEYGNPFDTMGAANAGIHQFNAGFKNELNWLTSEFVQPVTQAGVFRLYAFDVPQLAAGRSYALRIRKDDQRSYWAEFRQQFTGNPWLQNGILLNWNPWNNNAVNSAGGTDLLDTTPGTPSGSSGKEDAALVIGRTFSDPGAQVYLTPVAKGSDGSANWIDVRVNLGLFPGNDAPLLEITADQTNVATNVPVNFSATASDADGDALAYSWDFGDQTFGPNAATASKTWSTAGDYMVRCTVSDMKGAVCSRQVVAQVGSPTTYRASGRILDDGGQPLEGVRVHNGLSGSSYRGTYTDSDGFYMLVNLTAGSSTLAAVKYGYALAPTGEWTNPVSVGPDDVSSLDWTATAAQVISVAATDAAAASPPNPDNGTFTLNRTGSLASALTVKFNLAGNATYKTDYTVSPTLGSAPPYQLSIPAGTASATLVVVPLTSQSTVDPETVTLTLVENSSYVLDATAEATITVANRQASATPTVNLTVQDGFVPEAGPGSSSFLFSRDGNLASNLTVSYAIGGTAANGVDYSGLPGAVTIPAGESSVTVAVTAIDNLLAQGNKTVTLTVLPQPAYQVGTNPSASATIVENDPVSVFITATANLPLEGSGNSGTFTVTRVGSLAANLQVNYRLGGTATNGVDYNTLSGTVLIPAGNATANITVTPIQDALVNGSRTVVATLASAPGCNPVIPTAATITIIDDNIPGITLSVLRASAYESGANTGAFTFTRTGSTVDPLTVDYTIYGTGINGTDYALITNSILIPAGAAGATLTIEALADAILESTETVVLTLQNSPAYAVRTATPQMVTVIDNNSDGLPGVGFELAGASGLESKFSGSVFVSLSAPSASIVTVNYAVSGGTATGGFADYYLSGGQLTFYPGQTILSFTLFVLEDSLVEPDEALVISLSNPVNAVFTTRADFVYTIIDNDASGTVSIAAVDPNAAEAGTVPGKFRISRSGATGSPLAVSFEVTGTASSPSDYLPLGNSLVIPAGQSYVDLVVNPIDDDTPEPMETVIVRLTSAPGATIGSANSAPVFIADNDASSALPVVSVLASGPDAWEGGAAPGTFTISRDGDTAADLPVNFTVSGTAANGSDYASIGTSVTIPAGSSAATITITPIPDATSEADETVVLTLTVDGSFRAAPAASNATVTIQEGPPPLTVGFAAAASAAGENVSPAVLIVSLSAASSEPVTVHYAATGGTATGDGVDYTLPPGTLVFAPGETVKPLLIEIVDDPLNEADETILVTLDSPAGAALNANTTHTYTILNLPATLAVTPAAGLTSAGPGGGPFSPAGGTYTLSNIADTPLDWAVSADAPWLDLSASSGTLAPGASVEVVVTLNAQAETLLPQAYSATVAFTNTTNANGNTSREVNLTVPPPPQVPNQISLTNDDHVVLRFWGIPGNTYRIERSPDLNTWTLLASKTAAANGFIEFTDSSPPEWRGFYRIAPP
ncbi:MAG: PKD domain-containing protein [Akkermansiaceae bacterium]|nr:PKD domain-containing protein [Akkermansiaceae bacterium]